MSAKSPPLNHQICLIKVKSFFFLFFFYYLIRVHQGNPLVSVLWAILWNSSVILKKTVIGTKTILAISTLLYYIQEAQRWPSEAHIHICTALVNDMFSCIYNHFETKISCQFGERVSVVYILQRSLSKLLVPIRCRPVVREYLVGEY